MVDLVVSVGQRPMAFSGFWCIPWVEEDVDQDLSACHCEVADAVFLVGDPDVVIPNLFFSEGGALRVVPVQVWVDVDVVVGAVAVVDVVVVVVGGRQDKPNVSLCGVVVAVPDDVGSWRRVVRWLFG